MKAEILAIGTELLLGQIVNTNAAYISQRLAEAGIGPTESGVTTQTCRSDRPHAAESARAGVLAWLPWVVGRAPVAAQVIVRPTSANPSAIPIVLVRTATVG